MTCTDNDNNWKWHYYNHLTASFPGQPRLAGTRKVKPIWILLEQETVSGSGISWAICKSAPRSRQTTTPTPHHSFFYRPDALPAGQPTASKHWRHNKLYIQNNLTDRETGPAPGTSSREWANAPPADGRGRRSDVDAMRRRPTTPHTADGPNRLTRSAPSTTATTMPPDSVHQMSTASATTMSQLGVCG